MVLEVVLVVLEVVLQLALRQLLLPHLLLQLRALLKLPSPLGGKLPTATVTPKFTKHVFSL